MQNRYTAPAASSGVPPRPSGMLRSIVASRSGLTPTLISRPSMFGGGLAGSAAGQAGLDEAVGHAVDGDVHAAPFLGQRLRHADDAGLGGGVVGLAGIAEQPGHRRDVDHLAHHAPAGLGFGLGERADHRLRGAQDAKRRRQVAVEHRVPLLVGHLLDHVVPGVAGVVDDDVQALVFADGGADEALGEIRRGDAADAGHGLRRRPRGSPARSRCAGSASRSLTTMRAPSLASLSAIERPMPRPEPVMRATLPSSLRVMGWFS